MDKVKLLRMKERSGLMRTRMAGVEAAKAEVLTFLDSHIEVAFVVVPYKGLTG